MPDPSAHSMVGLMASRSGWAHPVLPDGWHEVAGWRSTSIGRGGVGEYAT